jgi:hypothetical protein
MQKILTGIREYLKHRHRREYNIKMDLTGCKDVDYTEMAPLNTVKNSRTSQKYQMSVNGRR